MEQVFSPLVVYSTPEFDELKSIAERCLTKHHAHHYLGFAASQWKLFSQEEPGRVKPLLYVFRVLLTGINLMQTGVIESNLLHLNDSFRLPFLPELIDRKLNGDEQGCLQTSELAFFEEQYATLVARLEQAYSESDLREVPEAGDELNELLVRLRLWGSDS
jgi:predicted nucleotidyltransferase